MKTPTGKESTMKIETKGGKEIKHILIEDKENAYLILEGTQDPWYIHNENNLTNLVMGGGKGGLRICTLPGRWEILSGIDGTIRELWETFPFSVVLIKR